MKRQAAWAVVLVAVLGGSGCGISGCGVVKDFRKNRHLKAAEGYAADKKWKEATIEYRNALRFDPENYDAVKKLGLAYFENGQLGDAFPSLRRYHEKDPADLGVRQKLGTIYLMGRAPSKAREQAEAILAQKPQDLDALLLLAESADTPEEIKDAIARIEQNRATLADPDRVARALGVLHARTQDLPKAEEEFNKAVSSKPDSPEAHLALARLHLGKRELDLAEKEFKAAADLAPAGSFARLQLADFYLLTRRVDDAVKVLKQITTEAPDAFPAWLRLAEIAFAQGKLDEAQTAVDAVLGKSADDVSALIIQARLHLAKREAAKALEAAQKAVKAQPSSGLAHYMLALSQAASGNNSAALSAAKDAVARSAMLADAVFLLGELQLQAGDTVGAITGLKAYLEKQPKDARAWEALGKAQLRTRDGAGARESFEKTVELAPASPRGPYLVGLALRGQGKPAEARLQFEKALAMASGFTEPLEQLATMSFAEKNPQAAIARIERQALLEPKSAAIQYLLGRAYQAGGDPKQAEKAFLKAIELNPQAAQAYVSLGQMYGASKEYDRSIAELDKALAARPDQPAALMLKSIAQQMKGDAAGARAGYEKLVGANPRFAPAANNLAWMLAEDGPGQDLKRALLLAQGARDAAPQDPQIADTLGWIQYKLAAYPAAEALLREAAEKLPTNAEVLYHLGMAQAKMSKNEDARASLAKSLELSATHPGAAEARAALAALPAAR
jgi:putative PEP-CTERM system TPR-repeat lipoprotein